TFKERKRETDCGWKERKNLAQERSCRLIRHIVVEQRFDLETRWQRRDLDQHVFNGRSRVNLRSDRHQNLWVASKHLWKDFRRWDLNVDGKDKV
ncbi:unnamed protein product, partial [Arabidopsis halleri]